MVYVNRRLWAQYLLDWLISCEVVLRKNENVKPHHKLIHAITLAKEVLDLLS